MRVYAIPLTIVILGAPRTKKTSQQGAIMEAKPLKDGKIHGQPCPVCKAKLRVRVFPSAAWTKWAREAEVFVDEEPVKRVKMGGKEPVTVVRNPGGVTWRPLLPLRQPLNCRALFYRDRAIGDRVGFEQGLYDLLELWGIIEDDKQLVQGDGTRLLIDRSRPRVEIELSVIGELETPELPLVQPDPELPAMAPRADPAQDGAPWEL